MSRRAADLIDDFVSKNIHANVRAEGGHAAEINRLVAALEKAAVIPLGEIEDAVGNLTDAVVAAYERVKWPDGNFPAGEG